MTIEKYTVLPYSFDLLYDIKSVEELHAHLTGKQRCATSGTDVEIVQTMRELGIPLPDGYIPPKAPSNEHYLELLELVKKLHNDSKREIRLGLEVLDAQVVMLRTGKVLANQPGLTEEEIKEYQNPKATIKKNSP